MCCTVFQSTHPSGVRRRHATTRRSCTQWGATIHFQRFAGHLVDFNPRTPVGCDRIECVASVTQKISIHAPQWGATMRTMQMNRMHQFQSTHPSGVRPPAEWTSISGLPISIHAPQWGATNQTAASGLCIFNFNPRTPVGCDLDFHGIPVRLTYFNPRTPVGCDGICLTEITSIIEFQSTHPSGVRLPALPGRGLFHVFQSTHPSGVRLQRHFTVHSSGVISIHAPQWGATI